MLATNEGTLALLSIEDDSPGVLGEHLPGAPTPLWPQVRMFFSVAFAATEFQSESVSPNESAWAYRKRILRSLLPSGSDASAVPGRSDVVFVVGGTTTYLEDGVERNWLVGDFADLEPERSTVLQWRPAAARPALRRTFSLDPLAARSELHAFLHPLPEEHQAAVRRLIAEYARLLPLPLTPEQVEQVTNSTLAQERVRAFTDRAFTRILDRVQPRVVLMEDASYTYRASLTHELKRRGIHVAEPQHGWIGPSHAAYNFGKAMREDEMRTTLPDTLLTFGSFWSDGIRHPANLVAVGKPHLAGYVGKAPKVEERPRTVLVASSVSAVDEACDFVLALRAALPASWSVKFRPHPSERATHDVRYRRLLGVPGVEFDLELDAYRSLSEVRAVAGVASTVLYEAAALGCAIYVRDSPYRDYYVGEIFGPTYTGVEGARAVAQSVINGDAARVPLVPRNEMWAQNPVNSYSRWLASVLN